MSEGGVSGINKFLLDIEHHIRSNNWLKIINAADVEVNFITPSPDWRFLLCMLIYSAHTDLLLETIKNKFKYFDVNIGYMKEYTVSLYLMWILTAGQLIYIFMVGSLLKHHGMWLPDLQI